MSREQDRCCNEHHDDNEIIFFIPIFIFGPIYIGTELLDD